MKSGGRMKMFDGKMKALTFSYDDGVTQDERLIEIFNKYGLKATFNLNSELLGRENTLEREGKVINHTKIDTSRVREVYLGHEVAVHTLTHPNLTELDENEIIRQVEEDRKNLESLVRYDVVGMAYPCGGVNNNEYVANVIKENTSIKYSRTITSSHAFDLQGDLFRFNPTVYHHREWDVMHELAKIFIDLKADRPQVFYIWGHSYEFDIGDTWGKFEDFCRLISNKKDIYYGTNREILLRTSG
jgi:peptidoglycan-N-acetylglucosamine deacetylase